MEAAVRRVGGKKAKTCGLWGGGAERHLARSRGKVACFKTVQRTSRKGSSRGGMVLGELVRKRHGEVGSTSGGTVQMSDMSSQKKSRGGKAEKRIFSTRLCEPLRGGKKPQFSGCRGKTEKDAPSPTSEA